MYMKWSNVSVIMEPGECSKFRLNSNQIKRNIIKFLVHTALIER